MQETCLQYRWQERKDNALSYTKTDRLFFILVKSYWASSPENTCFWSMYLYII